MEFFPPGSLDDRPELHAFRDRWYVSHLLAMQESPMYPPPTDSASTYRLLFLPTFHNPSVVRFKCLGDTWNAVCKRTDGRGGYSPGKLVAQSEWILSRRESKQLSRLLERVSFWEMGSSEDSAGVDGSQAVMEGAQEGRYHVIDRWSPHGITYAELVEFLLTLCQGIGEAPPDPPKFLRSFAELESRLDSSENGSTTDQRR